jgi:hypothetical protein
MTTHASDGYRAYAMLLTAHIARACHRREGYCGAGNTGGICA